MRSTTAFLLSQLAAGAWAAPELFKKSPTCAADNCLRAVRASSHAPYPSSAKADCSSFFRKTVTPCPATTTSTCTKTVTDRPATITATAVLSSTDLITFVDSETVTVTTIFDTLTVSSTVTIEETDTIFSSVTVTGPILKRSAKIAENCKTPACSTKSTTPTSVPKYASACSGTARYSSACSCVGVTHGTTTLPRSTVTHHTTSTKHVQPTVTVTATLITTISETILSTLTIPATFETTDATIVVPVSVTELTTIVATSTIVVSPPACTTAYSLVVASGTNAGQVIQEGTVSGNGAGYYYAIFSLVDATMGATSFTQNSAGQFISPDGRGWSVYTSGGSSVYDLDDATASTYGLVPALCTIAPSADVVSIAGAVGEISCTASGVPISLYACNGNYLVSAGPTYTGSNCGSALVIAAVNPATC